MELLKVSTRDHGRHTIVELHGELDLASCDYLRARLRTAGKIGGQHLVVDLGGLTFIDSSGLSVLVGCHRESEAAGGMLVLAAAQEPVAKVVRIAGLDGYLRITERLDDAVASMRPRTMKHGPPCDQAPPPNAD